MTRPDRDARPARRSRPRRTVWGALVPVVALAAGLLFTTSGQTARGTDLRAGTTQLATLITERGRGNEARTAEL